MKSFLNWASSIIFLALLVWLLQIFANNRLMGFPDDPEKNVSLVPSSPPLGDLVLTLQPPMETRQMVGQSQKLALQFFNRSKGTIEVLPERAEPSECFSLTPDLHNMDRPLKPNETRVKIDRLSFSSACLAEERPLTLIYSWKTLPPPLAPAAGTPASAGKKNAGKRKRIAALPSLIEERSISTTPIRITSKDLNINERFVRIGKLILLPVLLAIVTFIFQRFQAARDEAQNAENLKIQVWTTVQPSFLGMVKQYYSPILRRMVAIRGHIKANGSPAELLVLMLVLRRQMLVLLEKDAGYYFQSKPGEELVGLLNDPMVHHWRKAMLGFDQAALLLTGTETVQAAMDLFQTAGLDLVKSSKFLDKKQGNEQKQTVEFFDRSLELFTVVLAFELDRPFYPVWYEKRFPPTVELKSLNVNLDWYPEDDRNELISALDEYRNSIPWRCISGKTVAECARRIRDIFSMKRWDY
jgi:hypothetical protein